MTTPLILDKCCAICGAPLVSSKKQYCEPCRVVRRRQVGRAYKARERARLLGKEPPASNIPKQYIHLATIGEYLSTYHFHGCGKCKSWRLYRDCDGSCPPETGSPVTAHKARVRDFESVEAACD